MKFFSKKILIYTGIILIIAVVAVFKLRDGNGKQYVTVKRADVIQKVFASGKIKPNQSVDLGFDKTGRVARVYAEVGDKVATGEVIAVLESNELSADVDKAKASLAAERLKLAEIKNTAPVSYNDALKNLEAEIRKSFASSDDAVRNKADQFFKNNSQNPQFEVSIVSSGFVHLFNVPSDKVLEINSGRQKVEIILLDWQNRLTKINSSNLVSEASRAIDDLNTISAFLDNVASAVNTFTPAEYAYDTTVNGYKTTIAGARSSVSTAISSLVTAKDKLNTAPSVNEGGQFRSVLTQEAVVSGAEATLSSLQAALDKTVIRAPFHGVITVQNAKVGEAVSVGNTLVSIISQDAMYVEADISEIHISKITFDNPVSVTFDAFPNEVFLGKVSYVEPGDVIIDGVVNYKIRVTLDNYDQKIKSGLTSNLEIQTDKKTNVVSIPLYAVKKEDGQTFVNKVDGKDVQKIPVSLGLSGNDGLAEVLQGLSEGDVIEF